MEALELEPMLLLGMRLGEGSGCPIAFQVLEAACAIIGDMATFDQAGIDDEYLDPIRQGDQTFDQAGIDDEYLDPIRQGDQFTVEEQP